MQSEYAACIEYKETTKCAKQNTAWKALFHNAVTFFLNILMYLCINAFMCNALVKIYKNGKIIDFCPF